MSIERLSDGRYKVRYRTEPGRAGKSRSKTFRLLKEAKAFESEVRSDQGRGVWVDPAAGRVTLRDYVGAMASDPGSPARDGIAG